MTSCDCNKPDCIQCLIQSLTTQTPPPGGFTHTPIQAVVLVVRAPFRVKENDLLMDNTNLWTTYNNLQSLQLFLEQLGLNVSLNLRYQAKDGYNG